MLHRRGAVPADGVPAEKHLNAAIDWIRTARAAAADGGISKGYDLWRGRWAPSYLETTGYTIPTLLNAAVALNRPELRLLALSLADYLLERATPEGGVAHWQAHSRSRPLVFDTGQVMFGWLAAFGASGDGRYLRAARRAADWLVSIQDSSGAWRRFQHLDVAKVIDTRVAWAMLRLHQHAENDAYLHCAVRNLEWALQQQDPDGWFQHCAFVNGKDPFTHTLAYTAEGLFESGQLVQEERYLTASQSTADALLRLQRADGSLAGSYGPGWRESSRSSCLTGNCQIARLWLGLYERSGNQAYYSAARKAITFVTRTQDVDGTNPNVRGAVAGSYPICGRYERFKYPNWATKFLIDSLLALEMAGGKGRQLAYVG